MERPGAARGHPDAAASVPVCPVQRRRVPAAPLLWRQQNQIGGTTVSVTEKTLRQTMR